MSGLAAKISGDWFDIREALTDVHRLQDILLPDSAFAKQQERRLLLCVEEGTIEYKRGVLQQYLAAIEEANFRTFQSADYRGIELGFQFLTFLSLVQRKIANGSLKLHEEPHDAAPSTRPTPEIREIMHDIRTRIRKDAEYRRRAPVKNILMQINKYSREVDSLRKLVRTAPQDKKPAYVRNFRKTSDEIFASIKRHYAELLEQESSENDQISDNPLAVYDLKPLAPLFTSQAEAFASMASSLVYARTEEQRIREAVVALGRRREELLSGVDRERSTYAEMTGSNPAPVARAFARELVAALDRLL